MTSLPPDRRLALAAFLRARREALPAPRPTGRRRTPGLRREDVAQLSGLSTTWYTFLEQGRDISFSTAALARLADALHLTAAERAYVFELTRARDPARPGDTLATIPPDLASIVAATTVPAYLLDRLWQARAWNDPAAHLFAAWLGGDDTSLLRYVFFDPTARGFICNWEDRARRLLAEFRSDTARNPDDIGVRDLVEEFRQGSADFARLWNDHAVLAREGGARMFNHPLDGTLHYQQVTLIPAGSPELKLVTLLPCQP
jgi:transcriptional regulator with XRE-family HTH domain